MKKQALGRGLGALIDIEPMAAVGSTIFSEVDINQIHPNPNQPRTDFDEEAIGELAASIRTNGIISPITLRRIADDNYQIIAGERRYRASKLVGLDKIPAYIRNVDDEQVLELALIENIQREDLNAIEIALTYNNLLQSNNLTQDALADRVGKKRATITNYLRLLKLPAEIQLGLKNHTIDMGHARAIAGLEDPQLQLRAYEKAVSEKASVRRTEEIVRAVAENESNGSDDSMENGGLQKTNPSYQAEEYKSLCDALGNILGSKVKLTYNEKGSGRITIPFSSDEDLSRLMSLFDQIKH
ncbi:MAG: ParB/RepB/Spo0J family partition protein [Candidatus Aphodosoma sp.]